MTPQLLYRCKCGHEVYSPEQHPNQPRSPHFAKIIELIQAGHMSNRGIAKQLDTTKGVVAGIRYRYWRRVNYWAKKEAQR